MLHVDLTRKPVDQQIFTLKHPDRLVIDLAETEFDADFTDREFESGVVRRVRHGVQEKQHLRLVVDLTSEVFPVFRYIERTSGTRLVVDLGIKGDPLLAATSSQILERVTGNGISVTSLPPPKQTATPTQRAIVPKTQFPVSRPAALRPLVVAIDAGHGGKDPGAIGRGKTREKDINLKIAVRLYKRLGREKGIKPLLIRDSDRYVSLRDRIQFARRNGADLFVSIHADAVPRKSAKGSSVYVLSVKEASSETAQWLAENERGTDLFGEIMLDGKSPDLKKTLIELAQGNTIESSIELGQLMLAELKKIGPTHKETVEMADFAVLKSPDIPSVLVETTFISNPREERKLKSRRFQDKVARALQTSIMNYFIRRAPEGSILAASLSR